MEKARHDSPVSKINFRDATEADFDLMCDIHKRTIQSIGEAFYSEAKRDSWAYGLIPKGYRKGVDLGEHYRVSENAMGKAVGFSSTMADELMALYVLPEFQNMGFGAGMLDDAERLLAANGHADFRLTASLNAEPFYRAHGWKTLDFQDYVSRGGLTMQVVKMAKSKEKRPWKNHDTIPL